MAVVCLRLQQLQHFAVVYYTLIKDLGSECNADPLVNCFESRLMMPFTGKLEPNIVIEDIARTEVISV